MVLPSRGKSGTFCEKQDNGGKHINDDYSVWETNRYQAEIERVSILIEKRQKKEKKEKRTAQNTDLDLHKRAGTFWHRYTHKREAFLLSIQFVFHYVCGSVLLFQSGSRCTTIRLSAFKTIYHALLTFCLSTFITIHLILNYALYFYFLYEV